MMPVRHYTRFKTTEVAFLRKHAEDMTYAEKAAILGRTELSLRTYVSKRLRDVVGPYRRKGQQ